MKERFIIEINPESPLTETQIYEVMTMIQNRVMGYTTELPEFNIGKMIIRYHDPANDRDLKLNEILK